MGIILLYYKYVHIEHPKRIVKWQKQVCYDLQLRGRILIAHEGINGTISGSAKSINRYKTIMSQNPLFADIDFKESAGSIEDFSRLYVVERNTIVNLGIEPTTCTVNDGGKYLEPEEVHELLSKKPDDLVILDTRNVVESAIGKFIDAITPDIKHFRDFPEYIDNNIDQFKNKQVLMYCTGGVRCERATAYLKLKNIAKQVYQINGGIHRYVEKYPDGFFRGKNYVFDNRIALKVNDDVLGTCGLCDNACDDYTNCLNALCNKHFISCASCKNNMQNTCSTHCHQLIRAHKTPKRPLFGISPKQSIKK